MSSADIAVIGMAGRFPGARTVDEYWQNLRSGVESICRLTDEQLLAAGEDAHLLADAAYVRACPVLEGIDEFDSRFFGFSPRDAAVMDPQHRLFLQVAWHAMENAGYDPDRSGGPVGVFAACGMNAYMMFHLAPNAEVMSTIGEWLVRHTGNDMNFLATRVSYEMNLRGPSMNVQTACSSSISAVHLAIQSLLALECDMALCGGSTITLPHGRGYVYKPGEILSPDGHCRPFDADSRGTVFGSGAGCVVLKRVDDALEHGDEILAVIKASALNNDGNDKVGYLAPSVSGQAAVVAEALALGDIDPETITYVEAHGTGTLIGDPIEIAALTEAFRGKTDKRGFCRIGSVKSNIGHLGEAAGVASLIKVICALRAREIPPTLHARRPNPQIDFANSPFEIARELTPWTAPLLRAGITALGAGGTNAHIILEEAPARVAMGAPERDELLILSAKTETALNAMSESLAMSLTTSSATAFEAPASGSPGKSPPGALVLADVAHTLRHGRKPFVYRRAIVARTGGEAATALRESAADRAEPRTAVFVFPGGGAQYAGMGRDLHRDEPVYRETLERSLAYMAPALSAEIRRLLLAPSDFAVDTARLEAPELALPALFATELAMARLFMSWGLEPAALIGHSAGEYVAAHLAGVMSHTDALALVTLRGTLFSRLPPGGMLAVQSAEADLLPLLGPELSLAAINGPRSVVASGPVRAIIDLEQRLAEREIEHQRVHINVAAHSAMLEPILAEFESACRRMTFGAPRIPFASNLTGDWAERCDASYWVRHLRQPVRFADGLERLRQSPRVLLEIGPGRTLGSMASRQTGFPAMPTMRHPQERAADTAFALRALGRAWSFGAAVDWTNFRAGEQRRRVPLGSYPFQPDKFWIERGAASSTATPPLRKRADIAEWFATPVWRPAPIVPAPLAEQTWLVFADDHGFAKSLALPGRIVVVTPGRQFARTAEDAFTICMDCRTDYDALFSALPPVSHVLHAWSIGPVTSRKPLSRLDDTLARSYWSLLYLAQALAKRDDPVRLTLFSTLTQRVFGETVAAERSVLLGPARVIPREHNHVHVRAIDLEWPNATASRLALADLADDDGPNIIAYRGGERFAQTTLPAPLGPAPLDWLAPGTYLITGGLGGLGLTIAAHMAGAAPVNLVLLGRQPKRSAAIDALEAKGAKVMLAAGDVADLRDMRRVIAEARARFGRIDGVIHAAGVLRDELIAFRTAGDPSPVIDTKVRGALVLDELLPDECRLFVSFSSVSALLGLPGQIDYTAANAALDALAGTMRPRRRSISIDWSAWRDVGLAAALPDSPWSPASQRHDGHPWLDSSRDNTFSTTIGKQWLVREHVITGGPPVIPGTGFIELARAGFSARTGAVAVELRQVAFTSAFIAAEPKLLYMAWDDGAFTFYSDSLSVPHASGRVSVLNDVASARDVDAIRQRCLTVVNIGGLLPQPFVEFGPRWANIERIAYGDSEALIDLSLPASAAGDLPEIALHPALLDMATGAAQALIPQFEQERDFLVPFAYESLRMYAPLEPRVASHVRLRSGATNERAIFDVTILDAAGNVLVDITGFTMRRAATGWADAAPATSPVTLREIVLREGILPAEGAEAFARILASTSNGQIIASSVDLGAWEREVGAQARGSRESKLAFARPELTTTMVEPRTEIERALADMWRTLLGVESVGVDDDYFELGGESLIAVQLFAKIRRQFNVDLPLSTLFEAPTIARLGALLDADGASERWGSLVKMQAVGTGTPVFCVAGMGGNPGNLRRLAMLIGGDRPFYGLQPPGLDGKSERLYDVDALAEHYLKEVMAVQPHGPYLLSGYSGGGTAAFAMTKHLEARGERVAFLGFIDSFSPHLPRKSYGERAQIHLQRTREQGVAYLAGTVVRRAIHQSGAAMRPLYRALGVAFPQRYRYENIGDSWITAEERYHPEAYDGNAVLFRAAQESALSLWTAFSVDREHGWGRYVRGGVEVVVVPGDHTTMCDDPHVIVLAEAMRERLAATGY